MADNSQTEWEEMDDIQSEVQEVGLQQSEAMAEKIEEALAENELQNEVGMQVTAQYVQLTMKGALLFDSGSAELRE